MEVQKGARRQLPRLSHLAAISRFTGVTVLVKLLSPSPF